MQDTLDTTLKTQKHNEHHAQLACESTKLNKICAFTRSH